MTWIICHVYHSKYTWTEMFCWYKACYCYCWFCHRISSFNVEIIHATNGYDHWGREYFCIILYISGYLCRKVSRSACDQCKVILMPLINCIHFCLRSNIWIFEHILHRSHNRDQIITIIKDTKSRASCECFTVIVHIYVIRLHHVLRENNEHLITSNGRRNRKLLKFNYE